MSSDQLILADPALEPGWEILHLDEARASGRYTAEQLAKNEGKRIAVLSALAEGMSIRSVARAYKLSHSTVIEAKRRWPADIVTEKKRLAHQARSVAAMAIDRIAEEIDQMPRASLPIIAGIMVEKSQLLDGEATARVERTNSTPAHADLNSILDALPIVSEPVGVRGNEGLKGGSIELLAAPAGSESQADQNFSDKTSP